MRSTFLIFFSIILSLLIVTNLFSQSRTVFHGIPSLQIYQDGSENSESKLSGSEASKSACIISKISNSYYWASRENIEMSRTEEGAFVTFTAINGAGYVRVIKGNEKSGASLMSKTEEIFDYVEHMALGLRSYSYYGISKR